MTTAFCTTMLCALATLVLAAQSPPGIRASLLWLAGFGGGLLLFGAPGGVPMVAVASGQLALLIALMAASLLVSPRHVLHYMPAGGVLAVLWANALQVQGLPGSMAWLIVVNATVMTLHFGRRDGGAAFCTPAVAREALITLVVAGLATAVVPDLVEGWRTGFRITAQDQQHTSPVNASSGLALAAIGFACGIFFEIFRKHSIDKRSSK